jgi:hypothetical protein
MLLSGYAVLICLGQCCPLGVSVKGVGVTMDEDCRLLGTTAFKAIFLAEPTLRFYEITLSMCQFYTCICWIDNGTTFLRRLLHSSHLALDPGTCPPTLAFVRDASFNGERDIEGVALQQGNSTLVEE